MGTSRARGDEWNSGLLLTRISTRFGCGCVQEMREGDLTGGLQERCVSREGDGGG